MSSQPLQLPKTVSPAATKQYKALCRAYDGLADVFKDGIINEESNQRLIAEARAGEAWWAQVGHPFTNTSTEIFSRVTD